MKVAMCLLAPLNHYTTAAKTIKTQAYTVFSYFKKKKAHPCLHAMPNTKELQYTSKKVDIPLKTMSLQAKTVQ